MDILSYIIWALTIHAVTAQRNSKSFSTGRFSESSLSLLPESLRESSFVKNEEPDPILSLLRQRLFDRFVANSKRTQIPNTHDAAMTGLSSQNHAQHQKSASSVVPATPSKSKQTMSLADALATLQQRLGHSRFADISRALTADKAVAPETQTQNTQGSAVNWQAPAVSTNIANKLAAAAQTKAAPSNNVRSIKISIKRTSQTSDTNPKANVIDKKVSISTSAGKSAPPSPTSTSSDGKLTPDLMKLLQKVRSQSKSLSKTIPPTPSKVLTSSSSSTLKDPTLSITDPTVQQLQQQQQQVQQLQLQQKLQQQLQQLQLQQQQQKQQKELLELQRQQLQQQKQQQAAASNSNSQIPSELLKLINALRARSGQSASMSTLSSTNAAQNTNAVAPPIVSAVQPLQQSTPNLNSNLATLLASAINQKSPSSPTGTATTTGIASGGLNTGTDLSALLTGVTNKQPTSGAGTPDIASLLAAAAGAGGTTGGTIPGGLAGSGGLTGSARLSSSAGLGGSTGLDSSTGLSGSAGLSALFGSGTTSNNVAGTNTTPKNGMAGMAMMGRALSSPGMRNRISDMMDTQMDAMADAAEANMMMGGLGAMGLGMGMGMGMGMGLGGLGGMGGMGGLGGMNSLGMGMGGLGGMGGMGGLGFMGGMV